MSTGGARGGRARGGGGAGAPQTEEVVHRGVRWRRSASGRIVWFNEGLRRWVVWSPGSDAPPLPEEWGSVGGQGSGAAGSVGGGGGGAQGTAPRERPGLLRYLPSDAMSKRPPMRSPYRLVPLLIALVIVGVAVYQATRPPARATRQDIAAAEAMKGDCLARDGGTPAAPEYATAPVSCSTSGAAVKVVAVVVPGKGGACPEHTVLAQLLRVGVVGEPVECLQAVPKHHIAAR